MSQIRREKYVIKMYHPVFFVVEGKLLQKKRILIIVFYQKKTNVNLNNDFL